MYIYFYRLIIELEKEILRVVFRDYFRIRIYVVNLRGEESFSFIVYIYLIVYVFFLKVL